MPALKDLINKFLKIYPLPLRRILEGSIFISKEERYSKGDRVDGSYDVEHGEIILWNPENIEEGDLFIVLTHEWGHKTYTEWLTDDEKKEWLRIRHEERIDFGLAESYSLAQLPEEEYCTVFCIVSQTVYFENQGMKTKAEKIKKRMNLEFPKAAALIGHHLQKPNKKEKAQKSSKVRNITHREVKTIRAWIQETLQN